MRILLSGPDNPQKIAQYARAVEACGAIPVGGYLPEDTTCDGLLLCGGVDVEPERYGESNTGQSETDHARDEAEFALVEAYKDRPILGICRGVQVLNVAFGGTLYQHIGTAHSVPYGVTHPADAVNGSRMAALYGSHFTVNSYHHQAVARVAEGFVPTVFAGETIEAIEHTSLPIFGVQWHPERMCLEKHVGELADGIKVFEEFLRLFEG